MTNHTFQEKIIQLENIHNILISRKENSKGVNPSYFTLLVLAVQLVSLSQPGVSPLLHSQGWGHMAQW